MRTLALALLLIACQRRAASPFELRVAASGPLETLTPALGAGRRVDVALEWVFQSLATFDDDGELEPVLASRIELLGPHRLRASLRPDVTFSDGTKVTLGDVLRSLSAAGLEAESDGGSVVVSSPEGPIDLALVEAPVFKESERAFIGTGPFVVESQSPDRIRFVRRKPAPGRIESILLVAFATPRMRLRGPCRGTRTCWFPSIRGSSSSSMGSSASRSHASGARRRLPWHSIRD